jgi:hypothetical protein
MPVIPGHQIVGRVDEIGDSAVLAFFADDHPCATAKFREIGAVYDLNTVFPRI